MFEQLAEAIATVGAPPHAAAVSELVALADRLHAKTLAALAAFDAADGWALDGEGSLVAWLKHHSDRSAAEAARLARQAVLLAQTPRTAAAYDDGRLSRGQLDAILANLSARTVSRFAEHEPDVLPTLITLPAADVARAMATWRARAEAELEDREDPDRSRSLHLAPTFGGCWHGDLTLDEEGGTTVNEALALAFSDDVAGEPPRSLARKRADALVDIARFFLDHQTVKPAGRHRPHVNVVITLDDLADGRPGRYVGGGTLPHADVERLLCDCDVHRVLVDARGTILDYGRATRTAPTSLFNAIALRDGGCRHPGCDAPPAWCDAHHVQHWTADGETKVSNLVLKCRRHHRLAHRRGWSETLHPDGTLVMITDAGARLTSRPPGALLAAA